MKNSKEINRIVNTKRNKGLSPMLLGNVGIAGYDPEVHVDDAIEFSYKLPLGGIKRLFRSYHEEIKIWDEENAYFATSSSSGVTISPYCCRMINDLIDQLDKLGLDVQKIHDEVFDLYFKDDYLRMKRFRKNHGNSDEVLKPCNDPGCCYYSTRIPHRLQICWKLIKKILTILRTGYIPNRDPSTG